jgi:hypothetical protein
MLNKLGKNTGKALCANQVLQESLRQLRNEIREDRQGIHELEVYLRKMTDGRNTCQLEVDNLQRFVESLLSEESFGKVMIEAGSLQTYLTEQYELAKQRHAAEMNTLATTFDYHQAFKRGIKKREFTGTYFTPCRNPNKA